MKARTLLPLSFVVVLGACVANKDVPRGVTFRGVVFDHSGAPVSGLPVVLVRDNTHTFAFVLVADAEIARDVTDESGGFEITMSSRPRGELKLVARSAKRLARHSAGEYRVLTPDAVVDNPQAGKSIRMVLPEGFMRPGK